MWKNVKTSVVNPLVNTVIRFVPKKEFSMKNAESNKRTSSTFANNQLRSEHEKREFSNTKKNQQERRNAY